MFGVEHYHAHFWTRALIEREDVEVVGVFDWNGQRAREFAEKYNFAHWNDENALADRLDGIAICSATSEHPRFLKLAVRHCRAILCEKPLGANMQDCADIAATIDHAGVEFMQSFPKRFDPVNQEIASLLAAAAIGQICLCRVRHGHGHGQDPEFRKSWFVDPDRSGGGTLLDEGVHAVDFLRFLFGEPRSVRANISSACAGLDVEDTASVAFHYETGMIAEVTTSWCFAAADTSVEIYGTHGTILLSGVDLASRDTRSDAFLRVYKKDSGWSNYPIVPHFKTGVFHEWVARAFADALVSGSPMPVTLEDGWRASQIIDAAYRSAHSGEQVSIEYRTF